MNIIAYRARHNEHVTPPELTPRAGQWMVVETWIEMLKEKLKLISSLLRLGVFVDAFLEA
jgi:hypothetical protein